MVVAADDGKRKGRTMSFQRLIVVDHRSKAEVQRRLLFAFLILHQIVSIIRLHIFILFFFFFAEQRKVVDFDVVTGKLVQYLSGKRQISKIKQEVLKVTLTIFLKSANSSGVSVSALAIMGTKLTFSCSLSIHSMSSDFI